VGGYWNHGFGRCVFSAEKICGGVE